MRTSPLEPLTICLVGCGKSKLDRAAPAKDLYTGSLFRAARAFAETCDGWFILSARHHLVHPDKVLKPYNYRLPAGDRARWGLVVASGLNFEMRGCGPWKAIVLAGEDYATPVCSTLESWGKATTQPLRGLGLGKRLQWLSQAVRGDELLGAAS